MAVVLVSTENMTYEDWLEYRKQGIGGSDASVVCGINRYKSPVELWLDKTGQLPPQEVGEAAYWGTQLEALVRAEFTKRTGIEVTKPDVILQSEEHPFMLANLDGICEVPDIGTCIFEAKTASAYKTSEGKPYALFNFEAVGTLSPEEATQAKAFGQQFMEIVNAAQLVPDLAEAG